MRVTIFFEEEFLGVYPSIINTITLLFPVCKSVEIISSERTSNFPAPPKFPKNVIFHKIKQDFTYDRNHFEQEEMNLSNIKYIPNPRLFKRYIPESLKIKYRTTRNLLRENIEQWQNQKKWLFDKIRYYYFCVLKALIIKPNVLIAVDESGLIAASLVKLISPQKSRLVFWSLEIDTAKNTIFFKRIHEMLFSLCLRLAEVVVIQEKTRLRTIEQKLNYRFLHQKVFLIPHSPIGDGETPLRSGSRQNNFFRNLFSLPSTDRLILHAGWIHDAMCVDQFAAASKFWKPQYKLVLHEREKRSRKESFIKYVFKLSGERALLSLDPVTFDRMGEVFSSANIGLIAYDKRYGAGRENALKASGKLGQYLKCGVPVVALDLPGYREMFSKYRCGIVFEQFDEIENCIDTIFSDYERFRKEALRCFKEEFDFRKFFTPLLNYLNT